MTGYTALGFMYVTVGVVGVTLNWLNICVFRKHSVGMGPKAVMHMNFAAVNIFIVVVAFLPAVSAFAGSWYWGPTLCQIYGFCGMFGGMSQIGAIVSLAWEQFIGSKNPNVKGQFQVYLAWLFGLFWGVGPLLGWCRYALEAGGVSCTYDWSIVDTNFLTFAAAICIVGFVVPYSMVVYYLGATTWKDADAEPKHDKLFSESQMWKIVSLISMASFLAWTPYALVTVMAMISGPASVPDIIGIYSPVFAKSGVCATPLMYGLVSSKFRKALGEVVFGSTPGIEEKTK